jgi:hypothetical protein
VCRDEKLSRRALICRVTIKLLSRQGARLEGSMKERIGQGLNIIEYEECAEIRSLICEMGRRNKKGEMWIESLSGRTIQGHRQRDWMWRFAHGAFSTNL